MSGQRGSYYLLLILLLGFGLRLLITLNNLEMALAPDEREYFTRAQAAAQDITQDRTVFRPPLYSYTLALVFRVAGEARFVIGVFHSLLDTLSIALMYALTRALFRKDPKGFENPSGLGLVAALLYAISPTALGLVGAILTEPLFMCLTLAGFLLTVRAAQSSNLPLALLGGITLALAALAREVNLYFALLFIPLWWLIFVGQSWLRREPRADAGCSSAERRTRILQTALFVGGIVLVLTPWVIRNAVVEERFLLVSSSGEYNFARDNVRTMALMEDAGETPGLSDTIRMQILSELRAQPPNERAGYAFRLGMSAISENGLYWLGRKASIIRGFWTPFRFERANLGVSKLEAPWRELASNAVTLYLLGVIVFATLGLIAAPDTPSKLLIALFVFYSLALFVLTHYQLRYRYPVHVMVLPYVAYGLWLVGTMIRERKWDRQLLSASRLALTILTLAVFMPLIFS